MDGRKGFFDFFLKNNQLMGHLRAVWVEEENEGAMFFTYEHVHCVHIPEALERAWCNPVFRYNIVCLNLDYCPSICEAM